MCAYSERLQIAIGVVVSFNRRLKSKYHKRTLRTTTAITASLKIQTYAHNTSVQAVVKQKRKGFAAARSHRKNIINACVCPELFYSLALNSAKSSQKLIPTSIFAKPNTSARRAT